MATIAELQPKQGNVEVVVEVVEKGEIREFQKFGKTGRVCNAKVKDATGEIELTLWNEDIDTVSVGDKIKITNGYVNEWQGEKQLTTGKFGKMEKVEGDAPQPAPEEPKPSSESENGLENPEDSQKEVFTNIPPEQMKDNIENL